jgi:N-acetylmuramoyl-L-alanine amidase
MKIYLSPSTQENNVGQGNYGTEESRMNQLADTLTPLLEKYGHVVFRNTPTMTLSQIVADSNAKNVDFHLALHTNAGGGHGCEIYDHKNGGKGEEFARAIYKYIEPLTPSADRGVKEGYNLYGDGKPLYETAYTNAPAVLIEIAFHDNITDADFIINNMSAIATAITSGINEVANIETYIDTYKPKYDALVVDLKELVSKYKPNMSEDNDNEKYKAIIQTHCHFSDPAAVWQLVYDHAYYKDVFRIWANSYKEG